ncbi:MAG: hypothetical protein JOZ54_11065 [Acidobacteria bacterium]|nr:hypothetical protein [Acidobacteriota bacterium]
MADGKTPATAPDHPDTVGPFDQILYWINTSVDDFDVPAFQLALPSGVKQRDSAVVSLASRDGVAGKYHAFFAWAVSSEDVALTIDYHDGPMDHAADEKEPYAEELMRWLARFFNTDSVTAHAHVRLRYSTATHATKMPLALAAEAPADAELYGVALRLRTKPHGATSVRLTRGQSHWYAEVIGERPVVFANSTPMDDVSVFREVLSLFVEEISG